MQKYKIASASVAVFVKKKVLLIYNIKKQLWEFPGGKHELGESSLECAVRECDEECGLTLTPEKLKFLHTQENSKCLCVVYTAKLKPNDPTVNVQEFFHNKKDYSHSEYQWLDMSKFDKVPNIRPECIAAINKFIELKGQK